MSQERPNPNEPEPIPSRVINKSLHKKQESRGLGPIVIVGAGAAGLMAAAWAGRGPRPVLLLEGTGRPGQKILISGGGRCNVLPAHAGAGDFITDGSIHTVRKILAAWPLAEVRRFFEEDLAVPLKLEPETGKLFPTAGRARPVLDALLTAVSQRNVAMRLDARVQDIARDGESWLLRLADGETIRAGRVVLATGGLSAPATGSDGRGLRIVERLGHVLVPPYPALVPLATGNSAHRGLAGVSLLVTLTCPRPDGKGTVQSHGGFLFTHRGYSGPAALNVAHLAARAMLEGRPRLPVWVQWTALDAPAWDEALRGGQGPVLALLRRHLPERLAAQLLVEAGLSSVDLSHLRREDRQTLVAVLTHYPLPWSGHEGYQTAEVTGGGVSLSEVSPATLESRLLPGLYLCGEMLDAFGPIGGYNFLWAWVTGRIAGEACYRSDL